MRTTVAIPDELYQTARSFIGETSFSQLVREALQAHVERLNAERLARAMEEGYESEAKSPSLDAAWVVVEADGWS